MAQLAVVGWLIAGSCTWPCPQNPDWLCPCCEINCDTSSNASEGPCGLHWHSSPFLLFLQIKLLYGIRIRNYLGRWYVIIHNCWFNKAILFTREGKDMGPILIICALLSSTTCKQSSKYLGFHLYRGQNLSQNFEECPILSHSMTRETQNNFCFIHLFREKAYFKTNWGNITQHKFHYRTKILKDRASYV